MKYFAGFDYSLVSPALCLIPESEDLILENTYFFYITNKKKQAIISQVQGINIFGMYIDQPELQPENRYDTCSEYFIDILANFNIISIGIEDYAFNKHSSSLTKLAENCGILKYQLYKNNYPITRHSPSKIKKFQTGDAKADKQQMIDQMNLDMGINVGVYIFNQLKPLSPVHDLADSLAIAKLEKHEEMERRRLEKDYLDREEKKRQRLLDADKRRNTGKKKEGSDEDKS